MNNLYVKQQTVMVDKNQDTTLRITPLVKFQPSTTEMTTKVKISWQCRSLIRRVQKGGGVVMRLFIMLYLGFFVNHYRLWFNRSYSQCCIWVFFVNHYRLWLSIRLLSNFNLLQQKWQQRSKLADNAGPWLGGYKKAEVW
jgi:hypothetical protein